MNRAVLNAINARGPAMINEELSTPKGKIVLCPDSVQEPLSPDLTTRYSRRFSYHSGRFSVPSGDTSRSSSVDTWCSEESIAMESSHTTVNVVLDTPDVGAAPWKPVPTQQIMTIFHGLEQDVPSVSSQQTQAELEDVAASEERKLVAFQSEKLQQSRKCEKMVKKMEAQLQKSTKKTIKVFCKEQKHEKALLQKCFDELSPGCARQTKETRSRRMQNKRSCNEEIRIHRELQERLLVLSEEMRQYNAILKKLHEQQQQAWDSCNEKIDNLPKDLYKAIIKTGMDDARKRALGLNEAKKFGAVPKLCKEFFRHEKGGRIGQPSLVPGTCRQVRVCRPICATRVSLLDQARMSCCGSDSCMWMRPCATLPLAILQQSLCMMLRPVGVRG
eukprot:m.918819 g.918819  ORF g.918819 m.918819 type:complete len:388 (+) comp23747_c0_seq6:204-1367(+)